jgi:hypothetical protein
VLLKATSLAPALAINPQKTMAHDFLPNFDSPNFSTRPRWTVVSCPAFLIQSMLFSLDAALRNSEMNILAPPNNE